MDKRILKIAEQAGFSIIKAKGLKESVPADIFAGGHILVNSELQKFAELIIQNCIGVLKNTIEMQCQTESEKFGCNCGIMDIQDHFGFVEPGDVTIYLE